jgi:hypothetical protein
MYQFERCGRRATAKPKSNEIRKTMIRLTTSVGISLLLLANQAVAAITAFSDRAVFETAVSSLSGARSDENFEFFSADTSFSANSIALNGFSVSAFGTAGSTAYQVDVVPFESSGKQNVNGTNYLRGNNFGTNRGYEFSFTPAIFAFGFDVDDVENVSTSLLLSDGTTFNLSNGFNGFVSDLPITFARSAGGGTGDSVGFDDFTTVAVPEPSSAYLLGVFVLVLTQLRRRN